MQAVINLWNMAAEAYWMFVAFVVCDGPCEVKESRERHEGFQCGADVEWMIGVITVSKYYSAD
jgi:hypothetical protein